MKRLALTLAGCAALVLYSASASAIALPGSCAPLLSFESASGPPLASYGITTLSCNAGTLGVTSSAISSGEWSHYSLAPDATLRLAARDSISFSGELPAFKSIVLSAPWVVLSDLGASGWGSLTINSANFMANGNHVAAGPGGTVLINGNAVSTPTLLGGTTISVAGGNLLLRASIAAVPEPGSYAMLLAGLTCLGFIARRHRSRPRC